MKMRRVSKYQIFEAFTTHLDYKMLNLVSQDKLTSGKLNKKGPSPIKEFQLRT